MIEVKNVPTPGIIFVTSVTPNAPKHIFDLSEYDVQIYYCKLFKNRSSRNALYINKYRSLEELEKDIYGQCVYYRYSNYTTVTFKEIYNNLNKEEFLDKINAMIEKYGNAIIADIDICVKTDELPIKLMELYDKIMESI